MKNIRKLILASMTSMILSACGGGGSDAGTTEGRVTGNGNSGGAPVNAEGIFKSSYDTNVFFSPDAGFNSTYDGFLGQNSKGCIESYNDYYYETENTLIFGNPDLREADFKQAATWIEKNFNESLAVMGITKKQYFSARGNIRLKAISHLGLSLSGLTGDEPYGAFTLLTVDERGMYSQMERQDRAYKMLVSASSEDLKGTLLDGKTYENYESEWQFILEDKIYVCLHENTNSWGWGEGHSAGITIGAPSVYTPKNVEQLIKHELIHAIQWALGGFYNGMAFPRWFTEGQAVYLSGMEVAKKSEHAEFDPTRVLSYWDETGDPSIGYKHYALAYQYLAEANGHSAILNMMKQSKLYFSTNTLEGEEQEAYTKAFNESMVKMDDSQLTAEDFRINYQSIMNDYANQ